MRITACSRLALCAGLMAVPAADRGDGTELTVAPSELAVPSEPAPTPKAEEPAADDACDGVWSTLENLPALPVASLDVSERAAVLAAAKGAPVFFGEIPKVDGAVARQRGWLENAVHPARALRRLRRSLRHHPALLRRIVLPGGYAFAQAPGLAAAIVDQLRLEELFDATALRLRRGSDEYPLERRDGGYVYAAGPEVGERATLLLYDQVWSSDEAQPAALAWDAGPVRRRLGFDRLRVLRRVEQGFLTELRYGNLWIPTILRGAAPTLGFVCERAAPGFSERLRAARTWASRRATVLDRLRRAIDQQVKEGLPFDEPRTEMGQEDGKLRQHWRWAYRRGESSYEFNGDRYYVFDAQGSPRVPQVCIDFITDTLERASGSWWRGHGQPRERERGSLDFDGLDLENRRSVEHFIRFAERMPRWFDVYRLREEEKIAFLRRDDFVRHLVEHRDRYIPGDIVAIYGLRDDERLHYHSFFVYDTDPVTGLATLLAANAGAPRLRSWRGEMRSAPRRSLFARVRPRLEWLESLFEVERSAGRPPGDDGSRGG